MAMVQSLGAAVRVGWNVESAVLAVKRAATLTPGLWAMLRAAVTVSVGAVPSSAGALVKSLAQPEVPSELTQSTRRLASELISAWGTSPLAEMFWMRATPVEGSTRLLTVRKALAMPCCAPDVGA